MSRIITAVVVILLVAGHAKPECPVVPQGQTAYHKDDYDNCIQALKDQVQRELQASVTYLGMSAYFGTDKVSRYGFSKFFRDSANEERGHAAKMIQYLLMRGYRKVDFIQKKMTPISIAEQTKYQWDDGSEALKQALEMEKSVTQNIRDIIESCTQETSNDFHAADWLSGDWLQHQLEAQRELAGMANTLDKLIRVQPNLGEFLFDRRLVKGEVL